MAQRRGGRRQPKLPEPMERTAHPHKDDFNELLDWLRSKNLITIRVRRAFKAQPVRPGDAPSDVRQTEPLAVGDVVRLQVQPDAIQNQTAPVLAELAARGWFEIVQDEEFDEAAKAAKAEE